MITSGAAKAKTTPVYGWQDGDVWYLSKFPATVADRASNRYTSKAEAETHAKQRSLKITWEGDV